MPKVLGWIETMPVECGAPPQNVRVRPSQADRGERERVYRPHLSAPSRSAVLVKASSWSPQLSEGLNYLKLSAG